jgi:methylmalonyl-CoA mutase N-terminal domain/subunit
VTVQALAAILGGTQSLHTNGYDEALSLPSEEAATLALRTQQILAAESGVTHTVDPLAGSYFVEALTDEVERRARAYVEEVDARGGSARAIDFMQSEIERAAYRFQQEIESGERTVVGVNAHVEAEGSPRIDRPDYTALERGQVERLHAYKSRRDGAAVRATLEAVRRAARGADNLLPPLVTAVKGGATLGEISDVLRAEWGTYDG